MKKFLFLLPLLLLCGTTTAGVTPTDFNPRLKSLRVDSTGSGLIYRLTSTGLMIMDADSTDTLIITANGISANDTVPVGSFDTLLFIVGTDTGKIYRAGDDSLMYKECDACTAYRFGTGGGAGTGDTLIVNAGGTEYSIVSNRIKLKAGTNITFTRSDSTAYDVITIAASGGGGDSTRAVALEDAGTTKNKLEWTAANTLTAEDTAAASTITVQAATGDDLWGMFDGIGDTTYSVAGTTDLYKQIKHRVIDTAGTDTAWWYTWPYNVPAKLGNNWVPSVDSATGLILWEAQIGGGSTDSALVAQYAHVTDTATALRTSSLPRSLFDDSVIATTAKIPTATKADSAVKALGDASGNVITTYYLPRALFDDSLIATTAKIPTAKVADTSRVLSDGVDDYVYINGNDLRALDSNGVNLGTSAIPYGTIFATQHWFWVDSTAGAAFWLAMPRNVPSNRYVLKYDDAGDSLGWWPDSTGTGGSGVDDTTRVAPPLVRTAVSAALDSLGIDTTLMAAAVGPELTVVGDTSIDAGACVVMADTMRAEAASTLVIGTNLIPAKTVNVDSLAAANYSDGMIDGHDVDSTSANFVFDAPYKVTSATSDSMLATQYYALTSAVASSRITDQTITKSDIDTTASNFVFDDAYRGTSAQADSAYATEYYARTVIQDQTVTGADIDSTSANFIFNNAYKVTSATSDSMLATANYALVSVVASSRITDQTIVKADIDSTSSNVVFNNAYKVTSATADSLLATDYTAANSAVATARITNQTIITADIDTTASNFVFDDAYRGTSAIADSAYATSLYARDAAGDTAVALRAESTLVKIPDGSVSGGAVGSGVKMAAQTIIKNNVDSTTANFVFDDAYRGTSAVADSAYSTEKYARDAAGDTAVALRAESTLTKVADASITGGAIGSGVKIAAQTIIKNNTDTTASNFVFDDAFRGTSAVADSAYATERYARDAAGDSIAAIRDGDTYTGRHDFGGAVVEVPNGASPTVDEVGELAQDTDGDDALVIYEGAAKRLSATQPIVATIVAPAQLTDSSFSIFHFDSAYAPAGAHITKVALNANASTTATVRLYEWNDQTGAVTFLIDSLKLVASSRAVETTLEDAELDPGDHVAFVLNIGTAAWLQVEVWYYLKQ